MFVTAETLAKDDLLELRAYGGRAIQPEYEEVYVVVEPPYDYDSGRVAVSLMNMWDGRGGILTLFVNRYELVEINRVTV